MLTASPTTTPAPPPARNNFLGIKSLQTIGALKRQLLELLSDAGFAPAGLRARAVEAAGRRHGGSDGVDAVMRLGLNQAMGRSERGGGGGGRGGGGANSAAPPATAPPPAVASDAASVAASAAAVNGSLLKALLCAALYPQVVVVETSDKGGKGGKGGDGGKGGKGGGGGGAPKFLIKEVGSAEPVAVAIHPSSVNAKETRFESKYLVYAEKVRTAQVYVRDASPVSPYALMLFGGGLAAERGSSASSASSTPRGVAEVSSVLVVDGWIKFRVPKRVEALILDVRTKLSSLLMQKIASPNIELTSAGKGILAAVSALLGAPPPEL